MVKSAPISALAAESESPPTTPPPPPEASGRRPLVIASVVLVALAALLLVRLGAQQRGGPAHTDESLADGIPATIYLPEDAPAGWDFPLAKPEGQRPPVVVVAHGYSVDRQTMSPLARSLARAGYGVVTFDFRGHGDNTHEFQGDLTRDFDAVVDWVERSPYFDRDRIAVLGHSMGAAAALEFATQDPRPKAVVSVSGGWVANDAVVPPNVHFIVAERDPGRIHDRQEALARDLGDKTRVESTEIAGTDHGSVLWSGDTVGAITRHLDPILGVSRSGAAAGLDDPRLGTAVLYLLVFVALVAFIGLATGRLVTPLPSNATAGGFALLVGALLLTMPLMATADRGILPLGAGQPVVVHLALAAAVLWGVRMFVQRGAVSGALAGWVGSGPWLPLRSVIWPGLMASLVVYLLLSPLGVVFHRMVPTTERLVLWAVVAVLALPFFAAFEALVRRGTTRQAILRGVLGRLVILAALVIGVALGVLPGVIALVAPVLILQYVILEVFAATCYASGRNPAVIAVVESVFIAYFVITLTPIG